MERKVCFISNASSWGEEGGGRLSKGQLTLSPLHWQPVGIELLYTEGEVTCRNSTVSLTVIFNLIISLISIISNVLGTVNLQFQRQFIPISLRPILEIVEAHVLVTV